MLLPLAFSGCGDGSSKVLLIDDCAVGTDQDRKYVLVSTSTGVDFNAFEADTGRFASDR
ncbi:MAG: hypothetical protein ABI277_13915 [Burkholderiaceae bacterium]